MFCGFVSKEIILRHTYKDIINFKEKSKIRFGNYVTITSYKTIKSTNFRPSVETVNYTLRKKEFWIYILVA